MKDGLLLPALIIFAFIIGVMVSRLPPVGRREPPPDDGPLCDCDLPGGTEADQRIARWMRRR